MKTYEKTEGYMMWFVCAQACPYLVAAYSVERLQQSAAVHNSSHLGSQVIRSVVVCGNVTQVQTAKAPAGSYGVLQKM